MVLFKQRPYPFFAVIFQYILFIELPPGKNRAFHPRIAKIEAEGR